MNERLQTLQTLHLAFGARDWFDLFLHYLSLSLLSVGGAITTAPDMHRFLVDKQHWLTDALSRRPAPMCCSSPCWAGTWA
jgi:chromate transporter